MKESSISIIDQIGVPVSLPRPAQRIICLVPSITELLFDLGLKEQVCAVTKFCIHPKEALNSTRIGGTKSPKLQEIALLKPDLIIANKEENRKEDIDYLAKSFNVYVSDVHSLDSAFAMFHDLGELTGTKLKVDSLVQEIKTAWSSFPKTIAKGKVLYAIWKNPWMFAGKDTYIQNVLSHLGLKNGLSANRYPQLTIDEVQVLAPYLLLLSSEPYPFKTKDLEELQQALPGTKVLLVDGEAFSWYGSRMKHCAGYINQLLAELT